MRNRNADGPIPVNLPPKTGNSCYDAELGVYLRFNPFSMKRSATILAGFLFFLATSAANPQTLRVVTYNINADTGGADGKYGGVYSGPGLTTVLQAIGNAKLANHAQPIDVLALQELNYSRRTTTLGFIVDQLNTIYGAGTYAYEPTFDPTTGDLSGNGPSGLVYNTHTVQLLGTTVIGSPSSSGAARAPMRYKLAPLGYNDHSADFFLYVSHMKSGTVTSDMDRRDIEATALRTNAATAAVGSNAHVIYAGDLNLSGSFESAYQTLVSATVPGIGSVGQAVDTLNPTNDWTTASTYQGLLTESATNVQYRDDFQLVTNTMLNQPGVQLVPNTLIAFGNGGNIYHQSVTNSANSTALVDLGQTPYSASYRTSVLSALTTTTDHLPVVADYSFATAIGAPGDFDHSGVVDANDYALWRSTFNSTTNLSADGNHDGIVDSGDYAIWRANLAVAGSGVALNDAQAVPEPTSFVAFVLAGMVSAAWRTTCRRIAIPLDELRA